MDPEPIFSGNRRELRSMGLPGESRMGFHQGRLECFGRIRFRTNIGTLVGSPIRTSATREAA